MNFFVNSSEIKLMKTQNEMQHFKGMQNINSIKELNLTDYYLFP